MPRTTKDAKSEDKKITNKPTTSRKAKAKSTTNKTSKLDSVPKAKTTTKKTTSIKTESKTIKSKTLKKVKTAFPENFSLAEYYDLPANYNKTIVKLLAQTPTTLFVYWDISDEDRKNYITQYGENFFEITKPILIVHNDSMNYSFEVDINDFANCWYLNVNDSKCKYTIELGRRPIKNMVLNNSKFTNKEYIYISSSNEIESPNNHILFDKNQNMVFFKNVKTNAISNKSINFSYMRKIGKIYNIYDMYKKIYKDENIEEYDLLNPSSIGNSSTFK